MAIPAPTAPYPAQQHGTLTAAGPSSVAPAGQGSGSIPTAVPTSTVAGGGYGGQSVLSHPPGYQQNANASGLDRYQSASVHHQQHGDYAAVEREGQGSEGGVWDAAKKWAQATGQKLAEAESEVWKRINKD